MFKAKRQNFILLTYLIFLSLFFCCSCFSKAKFEPINLLLRELETVGIKVLPDSEADILKELERTGKANLLIYLVDDSGLEIKPDYPREKMDELHKKRKEYFKPRIDAILTTLSKEEFTVGYISEASGGFFGKATKKSYQKLLENSVVGKIYWNRPGFPLLTESLGIIKATDVWNLQINGINIDGTGETICIVDTGVDYTNVSLGNCTEAQFLAGNCAKVPRGYDTYDDDSNPMDYHSHGTHVAGIAAASGTIQGVSKYSKIIAVKVCNDAATYCLSEPGMEWCYNNRDTYNITVVNVSIGDSGEYNSDNCPHDADTVINNLKNEGIPVTIGSGNNGYYAGISWPACSPNAISVGATYDAAIATKTWCLSEPCPPGNTCTDTQKLADDIVCFTNAGSLLDLLAPGSEITSTTCCGKSDTKSGTSMTAPHVAGAIALLQDYKNEESGIDLTVDQLETALEVTGKSITDTRPEPDVTFPRIDVYKALLYSKTGFKIQDNNNKNVAIFDKLGNLYLKGALSTGQDPINPDANKAEFIIQNSNGTTIALIDKATGNMKIKGNLSENQATITPSGVTPEFIIQDKNGTTVALIDSSGNMKLKKAKQENTQFYY